MPAIPLRDAAGRPAGGVIPVVRGHERLEEQQQFFGSVDRWIFGGVAVAGVLALLATAALSKRILRPVEELTAAARRMERGDLNARVDVRSSDEIGQLARAFNSMSETRRRAEDLRRRMVGDIAHELRTPLTNLRAQLEAIEDGLLPANADTLASLREETVLLARLVDDLQDLALAEAGQLRLDVSPVSVDQAARAAIAALGPTADAAGVRLEAEIAPGLPPARGGRTASGSPRFSGTFSPTRSRTARGRASSGSPSAARARISRSPCPTTGRESRPSTGSASSTASIASIRPARAPRAAPGSASRSCASSPAPRAATPASRASHAAGRVSS